MSWNVKILSGFLCCTLLILVLSTYSYLYLIKPYGGRIDIKSLMMWSSVAEQSNKSSSSVHQFEQPPENQSTYLQNAVNMMSQQTEQPALNQSSPYLHSESPLWYNISNDTILWHVAHFEHRYFAYKSPAAVVLMFFHYHLSPLPSLYVKIHVPTSDGSKVENCIKGEWISFGKVVQVLGEVDFFYTAIFKLKDKTLIPEYIDLHSNTCAGFPIVQNIFVYYKHSETQIEFATCLYKGIEPDKTIVTPDIASWIEVNRAIGVQHVTMYDQSLTTEMVKMINEYRKQGFVELVDWKIHNPDLRIANNGQVGTIQDCLYRYLRRAKYIMFVDLDEVIIPHRHDNLSDMMTFLSKKRKHVTQYRFYNSFWHDVGKPVLGADNYTSPSLQLPVHFRRTNRTKTCPPTIRYKNIIKVETAVRIAIHHVYQMKKGEKMYQVPEKIGLMHHYRTPDYAYKEEQIEDMVMSKYVHQVMTKLKARLD